MPTHGPHGPPPSAQATTSASAAAIFHLPPCPFPLDVLSSAIDPSQLTPQKAALGYELYRVLVSRLVFQLVHEDDGLTRRLLECFLLDDFALSRLATTLSMEMWAFQRDIELEDESIAIVLRMLAQHFLALLGVLTDASGKLPFVIHNWVQEACYQLCVQSGRLVAGSIRSEAQAQAPSSFLPTISPFSHVRLPPVPLRRTTSSSVPPPTSAKPVKVPPRPPSMPSVQSHISPSHSPEAIQYSALGPSAYHLPPPSSSTSALPSDLHLPISRTSRQSALGDPSPSPVLSESYDPLFDTPPASQPSEPEPSSVSSLTQSQFDDPQSLPSEGANPNIDLNAYGLLQSGQDSARLDELWQSNLLRDENEESAGSESLPLKRALEEELGPSTNFNLIAPTASTLLKKRRKMTL
ncbi:hypothetical protein CALCODRAFT_519314 [Calocera cornea HHB12733]|uniref:Uncharacterized protein n=1 Tax=Calocera cornea HHB12733 TaxID=1353952 RepID=A0A165EBH5_9BASI|nr:hypothetical protein CALCODRAFT_519314 [Calocera cornea HHB12733]